MSKNSRYKRIFIYSITTIIIFVFAIMSNLNGIKAYLIAEKSSSNYFTLMPGYGDKKIEYNANGGKFTGGSTINEVYYNYESGTATITKNSRTQNVDETGKQLSNYGNSLGNSYIVGSDRATGNSNAHVVTISGATTLNVEIYYNGESTSYDWVSIWQGNYPSYTASSNYSSTGVVAQKLGGTQTGSYTVNGNSLTSMGHATYTIQGDTVTFGWKTDGSQCGAGYGYYAIITGVVDSICLKNANGEYNIPNGDRKIFKGWNTAADGSGVSYTVQEAEDYLSSDTNDELELYAMYMDVDVKYAVQIYGINQDVDSNGNPIGLTFGTATGDNYNMKYVTHDYEKISDDVYNVKIITHTIANDGSETISEEYLYKNGGSTDKVTRTAAQVAEREKIILHNMSWSEIQAVSDKSLFEDCMLCGDTKSVGLVLNDTIRGNTFRMQYGAGVGALDSNVINNYYTKWNPSQSENSYVGTGISLSSTELKSGSNAANAGGYASSHIRATLIGKNSKTNESYAGNINLTGENCLYSCIESELQNIITAKKIKYATGTSSSNYIINSDISDKIWLFSQRELFGPGRLCGNEIEGLGSSGVGYDKYASIESKYYLSDYIEFIENGSIPNRMFYNITNSINGRNSLRSVNLDFRYGFMCWFGSGGFGSSSFGLGFGFCIN